MQAEHISILQASKASGLSKDTLRYYEKLGLIRVERGPQGYRRYSAHDIEWLGFLQGLKATGMQLRDIKRLIDLRSQGSHTVKDRQAIIIQHRQLVLDRIQSLQDELRKLDDKIAFYQTQLNGKQ